MSLHETFLLLPLPSCQGMMPLHQHEVLPAGSQAPLRGSFLVGMSLHDLHDWFCAISRRGIFFSTDRWSIRQEWACLLYDAMGSQAGNCTLFSALLCEAETPCKPACR